MKNRILLFLGLTLISEIFLLVNAIVVKIYLNYDKIIFKLNHSTVVWHKQLLKIIPEKFYFAQYDKIFGWYHVKKMSNIIYYFNHLVFLLIIIFFLFVFWKKLLSFLDKSIEWKKVNHNKNARSIIFYSFLFLIFCFITKSHLVIFFGGISGWDYKDLRPTIKESLVIESNEILCQDFFHLALNPENAKYINQDGYLEDIGIFMHFESGEVLPTNLGILNMVFPYLQYPILDEKNKLDQKKSCLFIEHVKYGLDEIQSKQSSVLFKFRYPNHAPYQEINYLDYPESSKLIGLSVFKIKIQIFENKLEVIGGDKIMLITC